MCHKELQEKHTLVNNIKRASCCDCPVVCVDLGRRVQSPEAANLVLSQKMSLPTTRSHLAPPLETPHARVSGQIVSLDQSQFAWPCGGSTAGPVERATSVLAENKILDFPIHD